jgi:hypothetical protein
MLPLYFVIIGAAINSIGAIGYIVNTIKGKVKPNRVSFLMWSLAPFIAFAAQITEGAGFESMMTFTTGLFPFLIFLSSYANKHSVWKTTSFDIWCGVLSIAGVIGWQILKDGDIAIMFSIIADAIAAIPTMRKAYYYPETEYTWSWIAGIIGILLTILTIDRLTFTNSGFLTSIVITNFIIITIIILRRRNIHITESQSIHR